jgi:hypothetical protein
MSSVDSDLEERPVASIVASQKVMMKSLASEQVSPQ